MKHNKKGFTLLEILIVIVIMGVVTGFATYSINIVFNGNTKSYANQFAVAVRDIKVKTLSSASGTTKWSMTVGYNQDEERYYWEVKKDGIAIETVYLKTDVAIELSGHTLETTPNTIYFLTGIGEIKHGAGTYRFLNKITHKAINVQLVEATGGVFIED